MPEDFSLQTTTPSLWLRTMSQAALLYRSTLAALGVSKIAPLQPGASYRTVTTAASSAEADLAQIAQSPTVYAAVMRRATSFAGFPIRVYEGYGMGDVTTTALDPDKVSWVASFIRLLETPEPGDLGALFPTMPGEGMVAQLVADLLLTGTAFAIPTASANGKSIIGLSRVHPALMTLANGGTHWEYRVNGQRTLYDRGAVCCIRLLSWQATGQAAFGVGAATVLRDIVAAESEAFRQTANVIAQGGADVFVTGKSASGIASMSNAAYREKVVADVCAALAAKNGRRVIGIGGDIEVASSGLTPADIRAPELQPIAKGAELMALGCVPIAVGSESSTYAGGVIQQREQLGHDEGLAALFEGYMLRPLAQAFARAGGEKNPSRFTARFDLSQHPGAAYIRTEAIDRMVKLVDLGFGVLQAASIEGQDLPKPEGPPRPKTMAGSSAPSIVGAGDVAAVASSGSVGAKARELADMFPGPIVRAASEGDDRAAAWRAREDARAPHDSAIATAAERQQARELDSYTHRAHTVLEAAVKSGDRRDIGIGTTYGAIDMDALLGPIKDSIARWIASLVDAWGVSWDAGAADAFLGALMPEGFDARRLPRVRIVPSDFAQLEESADFIAQFDRFEVDRIVRAGMDAGDSPTTIAQALAESEAFSPARALLIARTETVRSQESGTLRRYQAADESGVDIDREWMTSQDMHVRASHVPMDGQIVGTTEAFTLPSGAATMGPGLSGLPAEDCNCRCGTRAVIRQPVKAG